MRDTCVVNFAKGKWYPQGQKRLNESLDAVGYKGDRLMFNEEEQVGCQAHSMVPYGFKVAAFNHVAGLGYEKILWCDSSVWAIRPLDDIFSLMERLGHAITGDGWSCASWTSDACLRAFGKTREEVRPLRTIIATAMGLDLSHERSREFLRVWTTHALNGVSFPGDWRNDKHQVSVDDECLGHRHDQAVASLLCHDMGMELVEPHEFFSCYSKDPGAIGPKVALLCQGM